MVSRFESPFCFCKNHFLLSQQSKTHFRFLNPLFFARFRWALKRIEESEVRETEARTIGGLLKEKMDGLVGERRRRRFKQRLGLRAIVCCGVTWGFGSTAVNFHDDGADEEEANNRHDQPQGPTPINPEDAPLVTLSDLGCVNQAPVSSGMNLAAALAAERHFRAALEQEEDSVNAVGPPGRDGQTAPGTPLRVSLMRLLEEEKNGGGGERRSETMCCVCMIRKKGAAFIPCGHTFCRICSRELWLNRGSCPLCNRSILEILDIF